ncbi:hypothetical protein [Marinobacter sp.]|uniref:hypothetical protein n=1 Tax=Marinobacter sp. TaxID=50741 RepID=UPI001B5F5B8C|nr:hypothetical protein [Marinobacter sp.]MBQ0832728.1 hypothetical protein [Marinobacter sp.]
MDIYSRKIIAWEIHESESGELAKKLVERALLREGCWHNPPTSTALVWKYPELGRHWTGIARTLAGNVIMFWRPRKCSIDKLVRN